MSLNRNSSAGNIYFDLPGPFISLVVRVSFLRTAIDALAHGCLLLTTAIVTYTCVRLKLRGSANHALFATLGLFTCVVGAQLLMCRSCWVEGSQVAYTMHVVLGILAPWTGFLGIFAKSLIKRQENMRVEIKNREAHFSSKHSWCGLLGCLLLVACFITGVVLCFVPKDVVKLCHQIFGLASLVVLSSSQWFSYNLVFARREWSWKWILVLKLTTLGAAFLVGYEDIFYVSFEIVKYLRK